MSGDSNKWSKVEHRIKTDKEWKKNNPQAI